jgi:succinate dehydrogenase / fumarate reductase cytochrome b subunit
MSTAAERTFYSTTIGKKVVMAATGFMLFGFTVVHLIGNLQLYGPPAKINAYAAFLKATPALTWSFRAVMGLCVLLHIWTAIQLWLQNARSRPVRYIHYTPVESSFFSRNMIWTGLMIAGFVVYHLLHFTLGTIHPTFDVHNVHANVVSAFAQVGIAAFYVVAMAVLGMHMGHGLFSLFQSLGLNHPKYNPWRRRFANLFTLAIVAGNVSMPIAVLVTQHTFK